MTINWYGALLLACLQAGLLGQGAAQALPPAAEKPQEPSVLRLEDALRLALERNPEGAAAQAAIAAMGHRVTQARALPDPTISAGWAGKLTPLVTMPGDASSYRGIALSEQFPWPGKRRLQGEIAQRDVEAAQAECQAIERRVTQEVTLAYADYAYADQALAAVRQNRELLEKLAAIADVQYRAGRATQQDVLRAQLEISLQLERQVQLQLERDNAVAALNAVLQQPQQSSLPAAESLSAEPLPYSLEELYALAENGDTSLAKGRTAIERGRLSVALAERQYRPDIGVGYMFQQRTNQPDMNGLTVTVSLPVFWKTRQREAVAEAVAAQRGAQAMQRNQSNGVRAEVRKQWLTIASAERLLDLYARAIVPQTALTLESALASYQTGRVEMQSLLATVSTQLEYKINTARQQADRQQAIARIESLTGQSITRSAGVAREAK